MKFTTLLLAAAPFVSAVQALHFYFDTNARRCFMEELPSDTIVEGHYKAQMWNEDLKQWMVDDSLGIQVNVEELATGHVVVNTNGPPDGRFTFTSHLAGDHNICLQSNMTTTWSNSAVRHMKMYLDVNVGSAKRDVEGDVGHVTTLASKLRDLNAKVADIQREQRYMREVEATFRNASETTNSRAVWWSIAQVVVLLAAAVWQMRHLKVFFEDKKLR